MERLSTVPRTLIGIAALAGLAGCGGPATPHRGRCLCGVDGKPVALPVALDFGTVAVGSSSKLVVEVGNAGSGEMSVESVGVSGTAFLVEGTLPAILRPGEQAAIGILFSPDAAALDDATLSIETDSMEAPVLSVPLAGTVGCRERRGKLRRA